LEGGHQTDDGAGVAGGHEGDVETLGHAVAREEKGTAAQGLEAAGVTQGVQSAAVDAVAEDVARAEEGAGRAEDVLGVLGGYSRRRERALVTLSRSAVTRSDSSWTLRTMRCCSGTGGAVIRRSARVDVL